MSDPLPPEIEVVELTDGLRYRLPRRELGHLPAMLGPHLKTMGLGCCAGAVVLVLLHPFGDDPVLALVLSVLAGVPILLLGLFLIWFELLMVRGHSEVEVRPEWLTAVERTGSVRWPRRRQTGSVRRLVVKTLPFFSDGKPITKGPLANLTSIRADCEGGKGLLLAPGYPSEMLLQLARELAEQCQLRGISTGQIEVVEAAATEPYRFVERDRQPPGSQITCEVAANGVTMTVPPVSVWRGNGGLLPFSLMWIIFNGTFFGIVAMAGWMDAVVIAFFSIFLLVGIGLAVFGFDMARRRAVLAVVGDRLLVLQTSWFGRKRREWKRTALTDLRPGPWGTDDNEQRIGDESQRAFELQIHPRYGEKFGMLAGRDRAELEWLATVLRRSLRLDVIPETNDAGELK